MAVTKQLADPWTVLIIESNTSRHERAKENGETSTFLTPCKHCGGAMEIRDAHENCALPQWIETGVYRLWWNMRHVEVTLDLLAAAEVEVIEGEPLCWPDECAVCELVDQYIRKQGEI